jgi:hypothetical protein
MWRQAWSNLADIIFRRDQLGSISRLSFVCSLVLLERSERQ